MITRDKADKALKFVGEIEEMLVKAFSGKIPLEQEIHLATSFEELRESLVLAVARRSDVIRECAETALQNGDNGTYEDLTEIADRESQWMSRPHPTMIEMHAACWAKAVSGGFISPNGGVAKEAIQDLVRKTH